MASLQYQFREGRNPISGSAVQVPEAEGKYVGGNPFGERAARLPVPLNRSLDRLAHSSAKVHSKPTVGWKNTGF